MKQRSDIHDLLLRSLDAPLTPAEQDRLASALAESAALREERAALLRMRELMQGQTFRFQPFFAGRVMHRLEQELAPVRNRIQRNWYLAFGSVAVPAIALLIFFLVSAWNESGRVDVDTLTGVAEISQVEIMTHYFSEGASYQGAP